MAIEVKALDEDEFEAAVPNECVCGTWTQHTGKELKTTYLYIRLGNRVPYKKVSGKYAETQFKKFLHCTVEAYDSLEDLDAGASTNKDYGIDVILWC